MNMNNETVFVYGARRTSRRSFDTTSRLQIHNDLKWGCKSCELRIHFRNVIMSPSHVILSEAKNPLFAQDKLREGSLAPK